ncbi:MAG: response regulator [Pedobacter sp.]|nr:MAG: response regulator [Pedobacter sp.]
MSPTNPFTRRYRQLLKSEPGLITRARVRILAISIISLIAAYSFLLALYLSQERNILLYRMIFLLSAMVVSLLLLMKYPWRASAHVLIGALTVVVWSNALLFSNGVNSTTVQYSILSMSLAYYLLGTRWGACYAAANALPMIGIAIVEDYAAGIYGPQLHYNMHAYTLILTFNYVLLMYIHYTFFSTNRKVQLQESKLKKNLQQAALSARELAQTKANFLSTMSHELRTPLHAVIGMANLLRVEGSEKDRQENLEILRFSAENLMSTVNDILDFSSIERENIVLENNLFSPLTLLRNIYGALTPLANEKGIQLNYRPEPEQRELFLIGDQTRLSQILFNLLGNAIKFTAKGKVVLEVNAEQPDNALTTLHFRITDTGTAIPPEHMKTIFHPFVQVAGRSETRYRGTGLDLTIAFNLVRMLGGDLHLQSEEGKGTAFSFSLSYQTADKSPGQLDQQDHQSSLKGLRVLIAEDEVINVILLKKVLARWEIIPDVVENGAQALQAIAQKNYHVVLMDINMPIMDGFEASKKIRQLADRSKAAIPIIAVTASIVAVKEEALANPSINDWLLKPFNPDYLFEKLQQIADNAPVL